MCIRRAVSAVSAVGAALTLLCAPLLGQRTDELPVGARVRVTVDRDTWSRGILVPVGQFTGTLVLANADSLHVNQSRVNELKVIDWAHVKRLEVYDGTASRGRSARRGAKYGFIAGAAVSTVLLLTAANRSDSGSDISWISPSGEALLIAVPLTLVTTGIGAIIGLSGGRDRWRAVTPRAP